MGRPVGSCSIIDRVGQGRIAALCGLLLLVLAGHAARGQAQTHTVVTSPDPVATNRVVQACWTAPPGSSAFDWVALAEVGSPLGSYAWWVYTGGAQSGCAALSTLVAPGSYEIRYFPDGQTLLAATSNAFDIVAPPGSFGLSATPTQVVQGRKVFGCWNAQPGISTASDQIGLFDAGLPFAPPLATTGTGGTDTGCVSFPILGSASYELRYLYGGTLDVEAVGITTTPAVGAYALEIESATVAVGRPVRVCWSAPASASQFDWVILVDIGKSNIQYVSWSYTGGSESGCAALSAWETGTYEVRYLLDNGQTDVASSVPIEVVPMPGGIGLSVTPTQVASGRDVHACWSALPGSTTTTDAVGLFDVDQPLAPPIAVQGTCGAESGCVVFDHAWSGSYEARYLSGGTLDVTHATLIDLAVEGPYGVTASLPSGPTGPIEACWTAPAGSSQSDWVVLVDINKSNAQYVSWSYTGGSESGCASLFNPGLVGAYEIRYLLDNGQTDVASSNEVLLGSSVPTRHLYEWKVAVTADPQSHPEFEVGGELTLMSAVPRPEVDRLPGDPTIGSFDTSATFTAGFAGSWSLGGPSSAFSVFDEVSGADGVQLAASSAGRSVTLDCATAPTLFGDDGLKTRELPVPALHCPGSANAVTIVDSDPAATVTGELVCARYLPEPSLATTIAAGAIALALGAARRRR